MADGISGVFRQPFPEQLAAFRLRLGDFVPTSRWDDMIGADHDRAFMVAGALNADLLADLGQAVDKAISEGTTLEEFRRDFRSIVEKRGWHGWTGEGSAKGEAWRTKVIYRTNIATSRAAGRYAQHFSGAFKYLVYRHSGAEHFRPEHLAWDGLILPVNHPFWRTHYPINGWGCGCFVRGARTLKGAVRVGGKPDVKLPPDWAVPDPRTGAPAGIDKGWDYAPGATVGETVRALTEKPVNWDRQIMRAFMQSLPQSTADAMSTSYRALPSTSDRLVNWVKGFFEGRSKSGQGRAVSRHLSVSTAAQDRQLAELTGLELRRMAYTIQDSAVSHVMARHTNEATERASGQRPVTPGDFGLLGQLIEEPDEIEFQRVDPVQGPVLKYGKKIGTETYTAIFAIKRRRGLINLLTFYIKAG